MSIWTAESISRNVARVTFSEVGAGWRGRVLLRSDAHHDSPHNVEDKERAHLEEALDANAPVLDFGDLFDVMGGRFDKRRMESGVKSQHKVDDYFNAVLDDAIDFYSPYADVMVLLGAGNHETAVLKNTQINLTQSLSRGLKAAATRDDIALVGGYGGYVLLTFVIQKTVQFTVRLKYHHGSGGAAPVTHGVISSNRRAVMYPNADIVVSGHIHKAWTLPLAQETINRYGIIRERVQHHISLPGYKNDYGDGATGWGVERGFAPNITGACWLDLEYQDYADAGTPIRVTPVGDWS